MTLHHKPLRVLIPFNASAKPYGMERAVIELFDSLRPGIEPEFLLSHRARRERLPILLEIEARVLGHSFFSDTDAWPRLGKPRSLADAWKMCAALLKGNRDVFRRARRSDAVYLCGVSYSFFTLLTSLYCLISGKPIVYQFHDLIERRSARCLCCAGWYAILSTARQSGSGP